MPSQRVGFLYRFGVKMGIHRLAETVELGIRIIVRLKPCMFYKESLGKIKFRAFLKRVGPEILSLESVDYFGTSEDYWVVEKIRILISKTAVVGCSKLSLYSDGSCDEHAFYFWRWLKWLAMWITFLIFGNDVISLESRPLNFRVFIHAYSLWPQTYNPVVTNTRTKSIQKQIKSYYSEEYSTSIK